MSLSRLKKRVIAATAGILLLLCQSAAVAHACSVPSMQPGAQTAQEPCHESSVGGASDDNLETRCQQASTAPSGINIFALADLPAITTHFDRIVAVAASPAPSAPPLLKVEPPPLTILHCCLRN